MQAEVKQVEGITPLGDKEVVAIGRLDTCPVCRNENTFIAALCEWCKNGRIVVFDHYDPSRL